MSPQEPTTFCSVVIKTNDALSSWRVLRECLGPLVNHCSHYSIPGSDPYFVVRMPERFMDDFMDRMELALGDTAGLA